MFRVAKAKLCFGKVSQREAHSQVRPDEIKACLLGLGFQPQRFLKRVSHIFILEDSSRGKAPDSHVCTP